MSQNPTIDTPSNSMAAAAAVPLGELNFILVHVERVADVHDFYVRTLGMTVLGDSPDFLTVTAPGGGATLAIGQGETPAGASRTEPIELWWQVPDTDALHTALTARGVRIVHEPKDEPFGRTVSFADPVGNVLNAYQPQR